MAGRGQVPRQREQARGRKPLSGSISTPDYGYRSAERSAANEVLRPVLIGILKMRAPAPRRLVDLGCGNGAMASVMHSVGYDVLGIDASQSGIQVAQGAYPECRFAVGSAYDDLVAVHGRFPLVVSLEVIEHLYSPRRYCETLWGLLEPGGLGVISTPFHGYWKNLALAVTNRFDAHFSPTWEGGHIKFWSRQSLGALLIQQGFRDLAFFRVGRIPPLAKSLIVAFRRPAK